MRPWLIPATLLALGAASQLQAQEPHYGVALNLVFPTGDFRNVTYPATASTTSPQHEGYDVGLGAQFTVSFPLDQKVALRLNVGGQSTDGSNTAAGYDKINLRHQIFSVGGELQLFFDNAYRHRGPYVLGGISADFERFDRSFGEPNYDFTVTTRKSRMGAVMGFGHTFGYDAGRFTLEGVFHKTISGNNTANYEPPSTDFVKLSLGWVF